jgi:hypothetical protein
MLLNLGEFASAGRRFSKEHGIEKSAPEEDSNDEENNRDFDRGKDAIARFFQ